MNRRDIESVMEAVAPTIKRYVEEAHAPLVKRIVDLEARQLQSGADGAGVSDAVIDRDGVLILTLTDGRSLRPGLVVGKDGDPGRNVDADTVAQVVVRAVQDEISRKLPAAVAEIPVQKGEPGKDADMCEIRAMIETAVKSIERVEGKPGKDGVGISELDINRDGELTYSLTDGRMKQLGRVVGRDGLGFDDMEEELSDDGRLIIRRYKRGAETKEFHHRVPAVLNQGVYSEGREYATGDQVTWGGSTWIALAPTAQKPGQSETWRLSNKRGRDGKDGVGVSGVMIDGEGMLIFKMTDGRSVNAGPVVGKHAPPKSKSGSAQ